MANLFLASEILEMNVVEERNGAAFYSRLSERSLNPEIKKQAAEIAVQEKHHETLFTKLLQECEQPDPVETYPGEYDGYLQALLKNKMFSDEQDAALKAEQWSDQEALEYALKTEQATLNLLKELAKHIHPKELPIVQLTVDEEENHITLLNELLRKLG
jgi:rubrerythrin